MALRDMKDSVSVQHYAPGALITATPASAAGVDLKGFDSARISINAGVCADGTYTCTAFESSDNSTFTEVADADLRTNAAPVAITSANDVAMHDIDYVGNKRYIKLKIVVTGSPSTGGYISAAVIKGHPVGQGSKLG